MVVRALAWSGQEACGCGDGGRCRVQARGHLHERPSLDELGAPGAGEDAAKSIWADGKAEREVGWGGGRVQMQPPLQSRVDLGQRGLLLNICGAAA